jgi:hypothetical protein
VNRGGSWNNNAGNCRSANRNRNSPENRNNNLGFRVALAPSAEWIFCQTEPTAFPLCRTSSGRQNVIETARC